MSYRNELPQSSWNLPDGVSGKEFFTDESEDTDVDRDGIPERCAFCCSFNHYSSGCPDADESVDEDLFED